MASDPRRRDNAPILLAGDDAMDEEDDDLFDEPLDNHGDPNQQLQHQHLQSSVAAQGGQFPTSSLASNTGAHLDLISTIITPSPFAHHTTGPTSSRYRNALQRITAHPQSDTEAWQALLTEVSTCWKSLQMTKNIHALDAETQLQLDWIESCYGALLKYFPYSSSHYVAIGEILFVQSAQVGEEGGPVTDYGGLLGNTQRAQQAQIKLETILRETLGVDLEGNVPEHDEDSATATADSVLGTSATANTSDPRSQMAMQQPPLQNRKRKVLSVLLGGMCTSSVELWLLYIKTRIRHVKRKWRNNGDAGDASKAVLEESKQAYELALEHAGFTCFDNHILWKEYLNFAKSQVPPSLSEQERNSSLLVMTAQQHMIWMRSIYQKLVCHPMTGLDQLWQEYEMFERQQSEALAAALIQELQPKYQHARNVYLERNRVFNIQDLQWKTRLAVPPVSSSKEADDDDDGSGGAAGTGVGSGSGSGGIDSKKKVDDAGGGVSEETVQEYYSKMQEEFDYLTLWKKRCAFERTNPERLTSPQELTHRVRQSYKEMICVLTLYPEAWHMWSMWEDTLPGSSAVSNKYTASRAIAVLQLGQAYIPDSTLLVQAHAQLVEIHALSAGPAGKRDDKATNGKKLPKPSDALKVLESYLERAPTSLGFCLYQRLVRRYKGMEAARAVFARARRVLSKGGIMGKTATLGIEPKHIPGRSSVGTDGVIISSGGQESAIGEDSTSSTAKDVGKRRMVTNRLDPSVGSGSPSLLKVEQTVTHGQGDFQSNGTAAHIVAPGAITWHLYACHATIEHRLNKSPDVAARIYELGLRKHASFLTKPPYVLKYAQLLMELGDTINLRALLTRALEACGDSKSSEQIEALWDMTLQCEELWSISDPTIIEAAVSVERRRRAALFGPDIEDVASGNRVGMGDSGTPVGVQKSTLAEQLVRSDGYNTSSLIVNGLSRTVDVLDIMGLWGDGAAGRQYFSKTNTDDGDEVIPGGRSDKSYQKRLQFARKLAAGTSFDTIPGAEAGSKLLSARERLQQQMGTPGFQNTPIQLAIQQMPDWLRSMLLLLPASRLRSSIVPKVPPHMIEMALTSLRQSKLPAERPKDDNGNETSTGNKRPLESAQPGGGGDSSDEETGPRGSGGYGTQFRARQRARIANTESG